MSGKNSRRFLVSGFLIILAAAGGYALYARHTRPRVASTSTVVPTAQASAIPGWWYQQYFGSSVCAQDNCKLESDPDHDGLTNAQEFYYHSDPTKSHTTGDAMSDGELVAHNFDPSKKGHVTFDQATSDDNVLGESLVFNSDVTQLLNNMANPKLTPPVIPDSQIKISSDNSKSAIAAYIKQSNDAVANNFPSDRDTFIEQAMQSGDSYRIDDVRNRMNKSLKELEQLSVPSSLVALHKDMINFYTLLPDVLNMPSDADLGNMSDAAANAWYDKTQLAFGLYQKINLETQQLASSQ